MLKFVLDNESHRDPLKDLNVKYIPTTTVHSSIPIEIESNKISNINANLTNIQREKLIQILQKYK